MKTHVAIIGGGPAGLLLSQLLHIRGIDSVILERQSRQYVLNRIRAGVLEWGSVEVLRAAQVGDRMDHVGHVHDGSAIVWSGENRLFLDTKKYVGKNMMAYGQTMITEDLYAARDRMGGQIVDQAKEVALHDLTSQAPYVTYRKDGEAYRLDCDYIAGCDGFHGVSRTCIPPAFLTTYEKAYPFGWLGILSETPLKSPSLRYGASSPNPCVMDVCFWLVMRRTLSPPQGRKA